MPLSPYYLEVILTGRVACVITVMMYRGRIFYVPFESFLKGPRSFPYVFIIAGKVTALEPIYGPTFVGHGVFVLGGHQQGFDGAITFKVGLYTIPSRDLLMLLWRPCEYGITI